MSISLTLISSSSYVTSASYMSDCPPCPPRQTFTLMLPSLPCMLVLACHLNTHSKNQVRANIAIPETWTSMTPTHQTMAIHLAIFA